jgi:acyl dehydratase
MLIGMAFGLMSRLDLHDGTALALLNLDWSFKQPVRPYDTVSARCEVLDVTAGRSGDRAVVSLRIAIINQAKAVVQEGHAKVLVRGAGQLPQAGRERT